MQSRQQKRQEIKSALADHLAGLSRNEAALKYGIHPSSIAREMKKRKIKLSPEELRRRKARGGHIKGPSGSAFKSPKCHEGCNCKRHARGRVVEIIQGRKNCTRCTRWRPLLDYHVRERDENEQPITWQSHCKVCQRAISRRSKGIQRRGRPYEARKDRMTHKEKLAHRRRVYAERVKNPAFREDRREYARIYAEAKRREAGIPERNWANKGLPGYGERLPVEPLRYWVEKKLNNGYRGNKVLLAQKCGVDEAVIRRIITGTHDTISEDLVDAILIEEGSTDLWEVYPHLYT